MTVLNPLGDAVADDLWSVLTGHFTQRELAALLMQISLINVWNRANRVTRQVAGQSW